MVHKTHQGLYQSSLLSENQEIIHGFTAKIHGSMQEFDTRNAFLVSLGISPDVQVSSKQVHGNSIHVVGCQDKGMQIDDVDGFIYKKSTSCKNLPVLAVHVGDCVPLLFIDPVSKIIGAVHAGWKGTKEHIAKEAIQTCVRLGAKPSDIQVAIGPYIHSCCYQVDEERAMMFEREFPGARGIVNRSGVSWFIDIGKANMMDLRSSGVKESNIDYNEQLCTHCNPIEFYSYRRKSEPFGEIMGFIGFT